MPLPKHCFLQSFAPDWQPCTEHEAWQYGTLGIRFLNVLTSSSKGKGRGEEIGFAEPCRNIVAGDKIPEHDIFALMFLNREDCVMTKGGNKASVH